MSSIQPRLPAILAIPWREYTGEANPRLKLWHLCETYEALVRFGVMALLAELRHLPEGERRLDAALADVGPVIEGPTLAQWLGILARLGGQTDRGDSLVLPELPGLTAELRALSPEKPEAGQVLGLENSILVLRNTIAHGGGITAALAQRLLDGEGAVPGWDSRLRAIVGRLDFLGDTALCWLAGGHARRIEADGTPGEVLVLTADIRATQAACGLDRRVLLMRDGRCLDLWPLCDYAPATMSGWGKTRTSAHPAPQVYFRAEKKRLLYAALGCDPPIHQGGDQLPAFRAFFKLDRKPDPLRPVRRDFGDEIAAEAAAVRGREAQLGQLRDTIKATADGVLWVFGPGGIGKSYLVAKLAHNWAHSNQYITLFWRFRAGDADRNSRHAFFRHAIAALGDPKRGLTPTSIFPALDPSQLLKQFLDLLRAADDLKGRKLLFVLDGIDEIARSDADFVRSLFDWRCANAIWLCVGRHEGGLVPALFSPDQCQHVFEGGLPGMTAEEIRALIDHRIGPRFTELLRHDDDRGEGVRNALVEAIAERAAGLPLYVHFLCQDVLAGHVALDGTLPARLPGSLVAYYDDMLRRRGIGDLDTLMTPLVVTIAWAMSPLEPETLLELLRRRRALPRDRVKAERILRDGLDALQSMLRPVALAGGAVGYEPYHLTFRDHIRTDEGVSGETETARELFCECASDWSSWPVGTSVRKYLLRHGTEHLLRERRWDDLDAVARDESFLNAQTDELPTEPEAAIRTLQHALTAAGERDSGPAMAAAALRLADRHEGIRQALPLEVYRAGNLEGAMALADLQEPQRRVLWLLLLAYVIYHKGGADSVDAVFRRLTQVANPTLDGWLGSMAADLLAAIAPAIFPRFTELCVGLLADEHRKRLVSKLLAPHICPVVKSESDETPRTSHQPPPLRVVPPHVAVQIAEAIARSIRPGNDIDQTYHDIAVAQASAGDITGALGTAAAIASFADIYRSSARHDIAVIQASRGDFAGALRTAGSISDKGYRVEAFLGIARAQTSAGDFAGAGASVKYALGNAKSLDEVFSRHDGLRRAVRAQASAGDVAGARALIKYALDYAESLKNTFGRDRALREIAGAQAAAGDFSGALRTAETIADKRDLNDALLVIAEAHASAGDFAGALRVAEMLGAGRFHCLALLAIARALASAGGFARATATAQRALDGLGLWNYGSGWTGGVTDWVGGVCRVSDALAEAGDVPGAASILEHVVHLCPRIDLERNRAEALGKLAAAQIRIGHVTAGTATLQLALTAAADMSKAFVPDRTLGAIAVTLVAEDLQLALDVVGRIRDEDLRGSTLGVIAEGQTNKGDATEAAAVLQLALRPALRCDVAEFVARALGRIAAAQGRIGDITGALRSVDRIQITFYRFEALRVIALIQAEAGDSAGAVDTAGRITIPFDQGLALMGVASALGRRGDRIAALAAAERISSGTLRAKAVGRIGAITEGATGPIGASPAAGGPEPVSPVAQKSPDVRRLRFNDENSFRRALHAATMVASETQRAFTFADIAVSQIRSGFHAAALMTGKRILLDLQLHLPKIAEALTECCPVPTFRQYLHLAALDIRTAIHACGQLALLYPTDATGIAELLAQRVPRD